MTFGFGLEKLGLVALRYPRATLLLVLAITVPLAYCAANVAFSSDIREIFRSGSPEFTNLEIVEEQYPEVGEDILLLMEADDLFTPENLERLRDLHFELSLADGVRHVLSMYSARTPPDAEGKTEAVFPEDLNAVDDWPGLRKTATSHPLISGKLLSQDTRTGLMIIAIDEQPDIDNVRRIATELDTITGEVLAGSDIKTQFTGGAFLRIEIVAALIRDQRTFSLAGFVFAWLIAWLFLRSIVYALISGAPAILAIVWLVGTMQLRGQEVNVLTGVVPALVIVLVVASALHLLFGIRRNLAARQKLNDAIARSVIEVGPACVLASLTTAIALLSLTLVSQSLIVSFGLTAAIGTALAFLATITVVPALSALLLGKKSAKSLANPNLDRLFGAVSRLCAQLGRMALAEPRAVVAVGAVLAVGAGALYAMSSPRYQYREYLPEESPAYAAMNKIDEKLGGTETMRLLLQWPKDYELETPETLDLIEQAHSVMESTPLITSLVSLHSIERWMADGGLSQDDVFGFLKDADSPLVARIVSTDRNSALVTGYFPGVDASELVPVVDDLEARVAELGQSNPKVNFFVTGLAVVSAKASYEMIRQLNRSLLIAIALDILLIGLVFWSVRAGLYSILPNLLPIAVAGAVLYLFGLGLQFTSVVAFTIGFGIAVDNSIHVINHYRLGRAKGKAVKTSLAETIKTIGPILVVSTVVLIAGFGTTLLSELPNLRLFGIVSMILLATALLANLIILPATIAAVEGRRARARRRRTA